MAKPIRSSMKCAFIVAIALFCAGCAAGPAGEDDKGAALRAEGDIVLAALIRFARDHGHYPSSLYELTPRYIDAVPFEPRIYFDRDGGVLQFSYERAWPQHGHVTCSARPGDERWVCAG